MTAKVMLAVVFAVAPAALAVAQDWSELRTLVFTPVIGARSGTPSLASAANGAANATEEPPARVIARIQAAVAAIEAERTANGEYSPDLIPLYTDLAGIYLEISGYGDAIGVLEQAQQVIRRNEGLYSLDQADLIEEMIEIEMEITPSEQSLEREAYLRELVQRNPGDTRNPEILTRMARRQMDVADYLLVNGIEPTLTLSVGPAIGGFGRPRSPPTARSMAGSMLRQARSSYSAALRSALNRGDAELAQLFELEDSIIDTYYFEIANPSLARGSMPYRGPRVGAAYRGAIRTLEAQRTNISRFSDRPEAVAAAIVEIADWHLMFNAFGLAMSTYQEAMDHLVTEGGNASVAAMFSPETPVPLPALLSQANVFSPLSDVHGYVDVEIEINRFGGVRSVEVTGGSDNASDVIQRHLRRFVYQSRFRPRWVDGEWQSEDRFVQRYEFGYSRGGV